jgi:hypothetical protein
MQSLWGFCLTILTFALVGPPIGYAVLFVPLSVHAGEFVSPTRFFAHYLRVASYVFGLLPALIAGFCVAIQDKPTWRSVSCVGLMIGLLVSPIAVLSEARTWPAVDLKSVALVVLSTVSICFVPTITCWMIVRTFAASMPLRGVPPISDQ